MRWSFAVACLSILAVPAGAQTEAPRLNKSESQALADGLNFLAHAVALLQFGAQVQSDTAFYHDLTGFPFDYYVNFAGRHGQVTSALFLDSAAVEAREAERRLARIPAPIDSDIVSLRQAAAGIDTAFVRKLKGQLSRDEVSAGSPPGLALLTMAAILEQQLTTVRYRYNIAYPH